MSMELLNRSAVIMKPLRPYLDWAKRDDAEALAESVFENLRREPHVYLLPEYEDPALQQEVLEEIWPILFEAMLEGWVRDEAFWPKDCTLMDIGLERSRLSFRTGRTPLYRPQG